MKQKEKNIKNNKVLRFLKHFNMSIKMLDNEDKRLIKNFLYKCLALTLSISLFFYILVYL